MNDVLIDKEHAKIVSLDNGNTKCYIYKHGYVSDVCHGVKEGNKDAIYEMASFLGSQIESDCILIPAPQHTGRAEYTLEICELIKKMSSYNITILDIIGCTPRETLYAIKKAWQEQNGKLEFSGQKFSSGMFLLDDMIENCNDNVYFVDNVVSTGTTIDDAKKLIPNIQPLVFAVSEKYQHYSALFESILRLYN